MKKTAVPSVLGQISPDVFMRQYWQKKPLLIRQAVPDMKPLLSRQALLALAALPEDEGSGRVETAAANSISSAEMALLKAWLEETKL
jgi:ribosomal protein L16 Arg81 hydroxylase